MSQALRCRPSDLLGLTEDYERYCLDEAATLYIGYLKDGKTPKYEKELKQNPFLTKMAREQNLI